MENLCIITDKSTKGRLTYNGNKTKIPLSKEGKKVIDDAVPFIQKQVTKEFQEYIKLHVKEYNLETDYIEKATKAFFGENFNDEGVRYMVYNVLNSKVEKGIMYTIVRRSINKHLKGLLEKLNV